MEGELANPARVQAQSFESDIPVLSDGRAIDLVHLSRQTFGERDLEAELLRLFDRQSRQIVDRLTEGPVTEARWRADLAHTLKGSARALVAEMMDKDGTAIVLHAGPDDYLTDPAGNSGDRIACGVFRKN